SRQWLWAPAFAGATSTRPMADMANKVSINRFVYDQLSFLEYDCQRPRLDTEWLLSTLFDASLLSTSKAADFSAALFWPPSAPLLAVFLTAPETIRNQKSRCGWTPPPKPSNDLFIISRRLKSPASGVNQWCEGVNHGGAFAARRRVGPIERTADQFGSIQ